MISLADRYSYPEVIDDVISDFVDLCHHRLKSKRLGILLVGSASRGEISWVKQGDSYKFYSDIEFVVVVESVDKATQQLFAAEVSKLDDKRDLGERFKIDFVLNTWTGITAVEKKIFIFDSKNTGIELGNADVRPLLPTVTINNINFHELNDVLLHRMKALLAEIPVDLKSSNDGHDDFCLSIAKNALDITTWLYPYEGETLLSGFGNRLDAWEEKKSSLTLSDYFTDEDYAFLRKCLEIRKTGDAGLSARQLLVDYLTIYQKAVNYCKSMNGLSEVDQLSAAKTSSKLFWEYNYRRRLMEAYLMIRNYQLFGVVCLIRNIVMPRKGRQVQFCFSMIEAFSLYLGDEERLGSRLSSSEEKLAKLRLVKLSQESNWIAQWEMLREQYMQLSKIFI